jgi:hypothetical protein
LNAVGEHRVDQSGAPTEKPVGWVHPTCHALAVKQTFYVFLWSCPGMNEALIAYEDAVLALVDEHDGHVMQRARTDGADGRPLEIQLLEWVSQEAMDGYLADSRRTAMSADRERAIARTEIVPVQLSC